eukprot:15097551-Alexandrium_andersonii.AAC.1
MKNPQRTHAQAPRLLLREVRQQLAAQGHGLLRVGDHVAQAVSHRFAAAISVVNTLQAQALEDEVAARRVARRLRRLPALLAPSRGLVLLLRNRKGKAVTQ